MTKNVIYDKQKSATVPIVPIMRANLKKIKCKSMLVLKSANAFWAGELADSSP